MSRNKLLMIVNVLLVIVMLLTACAPAATPPPPIITEKEVVKTVIVNKEGATQVVVATQAPTQPAPTQPAAAKPKILRMASGSGDIPTIDPALAVDVISIQVIESTTIGLVRQNETTALVENGVASGYDISADNLVYTFHLRDNIPWVRYDSVAKKVVKVQTCPDADGKTADRMVTAQDFAYGILRTLNQATASDYAYVLTPVIVGAADYNGGKAKDASKVGVKALDAKTLQVTVTQPAVYNLNILGLWVAHAQPSWLIDGDDCNSARGGRWTETGFFQGYGPFTLKEWVHDASLTMIKNPFWPGTETIPVAKLDEVYWTFIDSPQALAEYEAGNLDTSGIPSGDMDRIMSDAKFKDQIAYVSTLGTEFYAFNTLKAPTDDARVRQALSMAIDRDAIVKNVIKSGTPAPYYTNPGAQGAPKQDKYPALGIKYDPAAAKQILDGYLKEKNLTADKLVITLMYNTTSSNQKVAETIQQMWKDNLGITVQLFNQERKVFFATRTQGLQNIYRGSWVQDYPDANNFLRDVFGKDGGYEGIVKWAGPTYDAFMKLVNDAALEQDPAKRMDLYAQAEKILVNDQAIVTPLYWYSSPILVAPYVKDVVSITGYDHYEKWDMTQ
jgi:oligopeptide transport system substrate-binding protein